jgi:hypothetical protein
MNWTPWNRFWCYTFEWHCPVHVWSTDEMMPVAVKCRVCGRELHRDTRGRWYCHASEESAAVFEIVALVAMVFVAASVVAFHFRLFDVLR